MGQCVPQRTSGGQRIPFRVLSFLLVGSRNGLRLWAYEASQQFMSSFQSHFFREIVLDPSNSKTICLQNSCRIPHLIYLIADLAILNDLLIGLTFFCLILFLCFGMAYSVIRFFLESSTHDLTHQRHLVSICYYQEEDIVNKKEGKGRLR